MIRVYEVRRREAARMAQLLGVWEASVRCCICGGETVGTENSA